MNKLRKEVIINIISVVAIVFVSFCTFKTINYIVSVIESNFINIGVTLPLIISGCSLYYLLIFYFFDAYIKFVPFKSRLIRLIVNGTVNLLAIILYFVYINDFIYNLTHEFTFTHLIFFIASLCSLIFDILSIIYTKNGKYNEEYFAKNRYFSHMNKLDFFILLIDGIFTCYILYSMIVLLNNIKDITYCPFGYAFLLFALHMSALSFITILIDKAKNYPVLKVLVTSLNFFAILLMFVYEIIEPGYFLIVAKNISSFDYLIKIPFLFYLLTIDLIIKMIFIVQQSIKK